MSLLLLFKPSAVVTPGGPVPGTITTGTAAVTVGATTTSLAVPLATTNVGDFNIVVGSYNSTGTGIQPGALTPTGWTQIGDSWKTGSPAHELAAFYRFFQSGDATSPTFSWTATGNAAFVPISCSAGMIDTTTPIISGKSSFVQSSGPTVDVTPALTLPSLQYVFSAFANRSGATWSASVDANIHDPIMLQAISSAAASLAVTGTGTATTSGGARSLVSSASSSVHNVGIFALNPALSAGTTGYELGWGALPI